MFGFLLIWIIAGVLAPAAFGFFTTFHRKSRLMLAAVTLAGNMLALTWVLPGLFVPKRNLGPDAAVGLAFESVTNMFIAAGVFAGLLIGGLIGRATRDG